MITPGPRLLSTHGSDRSPGGSSPGRTVEGTAFAAAAQIGNHGLGLGSQLRRAHRTFRSGGGTRPDGRILDDLARCADHGRHDEEQPEPEHDDAPHRGPTLPVAVSETTSLAGGPAGSFSASEDLSAAGPVGAGGPYGRALSAGSGFQGEVVIGCALSL